MRYWWVSQNRTYSHEVLGGDMWSPVTKKGGIRNHFYDTMLEVVEGDVVFSFSQKQIKAVGVAVSRASACPKPDEFGSSGLAWDDAGWLVEVAFQQLQDPIMPSEHMDAIRPLLPSKYSPLHSNGRGNEIYLAEVPGPMAALLLDRIGPQWTMSTELPAVESRLESELNVALADLRGRTDIGETQRVQLVNARRGQGIFRVNVRKVEPRCRVTGVSEQAHLRASHIKPWSTSDNEERLNGCNGLLLAPHIDHLFDRGFISFEGNGDLVLSELLSPSVLAAWSVAIPRNVGAFNDDQKQFLEFHRENVLLPR